MSIENSNDVAIDNTSREYRVAIPNYMYNTFIAPSNFKSKLTLSPASITQTQNSIGVVSTVNETYNLKLNARTLYDLQFIRQCDLVATYIGLQTNSDNLMYALNNGQTGYNMKQWAVLNVVDGNAFLNNGLGQANPVQIGMCGFTDDIVNKMFSDVTLKVGNNGIRVPRNLSKNMISVMNRFLDKDQLEDYGGLKKLDEVCTFDLVGQPTPTHKVIANQASSVVSNVVNADFQTVQEINNVSWNSLSKLNRMKNSNNIQYTFTKGIASPNAEWNGTLWAIGANTNALQTITIDGYSYPANYTSAYAGFTSTTLSSVYSYLFFTDKPNSIVDIAENYVGGVVMGNEPANQTLNVIITYRKLQSPLYSPILHYESKACLSNDVDLVIDGQLDFTSIFKTYKQKYYSEGSAVSLLNTPTVKVENASLWYKQYDLPMTLLSNMPMTTTLPYYEHISAPIKQFVYSGMSTVVASDNIPLSSVPKFCIVTVKGYAGSSPAVNMSDEYRMRINQLGLKINGQADILNTRTELDLYNCTKRCGLKMYEWDTIVGKTIVVPKVEVQTTGVVQRVNVQNNLKGKITSQALGSIIILEFGADIPIGDLVAGQGGVNLNLAFTVHVTDSSDFATLCQLEILFLTENQLQITKNSAQLAPRLFDPADIVDAINSFNNKITSGRLYVNSHHLLGGNWFQSSAYKLKSILPKVLPTLQEAHKVITTAKDVYRAVEPLARPVAKTLGELIANRR